MQNPRDQKTLAAARESLARLISFDEFLAKLGKKDKLNIERRIEVLDAEGDPSRSKLWRRLACALMTLAPHALKIVGRQTVQFYVADGKYRMQVFALEDMQDKKFTIYCPDVLDQATKAGLLTKPTTADPHNYFVAASKEPIWIERLDENALNPGAHYKDLTNWNRKALRVTLPPSPSAAQIEAAELVCALAAGHFAAAPAPVAVPAAKA